MPILLKKIQSDVITLFGDSVGGTDPIGGEVGGNFTGPTFMFTEVIAEAGVEDYIELQTYTALTQDFSSVGWGKFCETVPSKFGLTTCPTYENLNISY